MVKCTCSNKKWINNRRCCRNVFLTPISSGGQAAIMNQMIATPGVAYVVAANMILQANYLWLHKGNCQCAVLYLSVLAQMFLSRREGSHEGRREGNGLKFILSQDWMFGMQSTAAEMESNVYSPTLIAFSIPTTFIWEIKRMIILQKICCTGMNLTREQ